MVNRDVKVDPYSMELYEIQKEKRELKKREKELKTRQKADMGVTPQGF